MKLHSSREASSKSLKRAYSLACKEPSQRLEGAWKKSVSSNHRDLAHLFLIWQNEYQSPHTYWRSALALCIFMLVQNERRARRACQIMHGQLSFAEWIEPSCCPDKHSTGRDLYLDCPGQAPGIFESLQLAGWGMYPGRDPARYPRCPKQSAGSQTPAAVQGDWLVWDWQFLMLWRRCVPCNIGACDMSSTVGNPNSIHFHAACSCFQSGGLQKKLLQHKHLLHYERDLMKQNVLR